MSRETTHTLASWNVEHGGYADYEITGTPPKKTSRIAETVQNLQADTIVISDAFGWQNDALRKNSLPGFSHTYFQPLNDTWLEKQEGAHMRDIGVVLGTKVSHDTPQAVDLGERQGIMMTLNIGTHGLRLYGVYLNHAIEDKRIAQLRALISHLSKDDTPTIITGDLNAQEDLKYVSNSEKLRSLFVRMGSLPFKALGHPYGNILHDLERREALTLLRQEGFDTATTNNRPTALYPLAPVFRVDHSFGRGVFMSNYTVHPTVGGASDHRPISCDVTI